MLGVDVLQKPDSVEVLFGAERTVEGAPVHCFPSNELLSYLWGATTFMAEAASASAFFSDSRCFLHLSWCFLYSLSLIFFPHSHLLD